MHSSRSSFFSVASLLAAFAAACAATGVVSYSLHQKIFPALKPVEILFENPVEWLSQVHFAFEKKSVPHVDDEVSIKGTAVIHATARTRPKAKMARARRIHLFTAVKTDILRTRQAKTQESPKTDAAAMLSIYSALRQQFLVAVNTQLELNTQKTVIVKNQHHNIDKKQSHSLTAKKVRPVSQPVASIKEESIAKLDSHSKEIHIPWLSSEPKQTMPTPSPEKKLNMAVAQDVDFDKDKTGLNTQTVKGSAPETPLVLAPVASSSDSANETKNEYSPPPNELQKGKDLIELPLVNQGSIPSSGSNSGDQLVASQGATRGAVESVTIQNEPRDEYSNLEQETASTGVQPPLVLAQEENAVAQPEKPSSSPVVAAAVSAQPASFISPTVPPSATPSSGTPPSPPTPAAPDVTHLISLLTKDRPPQEPKTIETSSVEDETNSKPDAEKNRAGVMEKNKSKWVRAFEESDLGEDVSQSALGCTSTDRNLKSQWMINNARDYVATLAWSQPMRDSPDSPIPLIHENDVPERWSVRRGTGIIFGKVGAGWNVEWVGNPTKPILITKTEHGIQFVFEDSTEKNESHDRYFIFTNVPPGAHFVGLSHVSQGPADRPLKGAVVFPVVADTATYLDLTHPQERKVFGRVIEASERDPEGLPGVSVRVLPQNHLRAFTNQEGYFKEPQSLVTFGDYPLIIETDYYQVGLGRTKQWHQVSPESLSPKPGGDLYLIHFMKQSLESFTAKLPQNESQSKNAGALLASPRIFTSAHDKSASAESYPQICSMDSHASFVPQAFSVTMGGELLANEPLETFNPVFMGTNVPQGFAISEVVQKNELNGNSIVWSQVVYAAEDVVNVMNF